MKTTSRMSGAELKMAREALGLTSEALAHFLNVSPVTVRTWEGDRAPIPYRVPDEIADLERHTELMIARLAEKLTDSTGESVTVMLYRTDEELLAEDSDLHPLTARWWRHVVYQAARQAYKSPTIVTSSDLPVPPDTVTVSDAIPPVSW